MTDYTKTGNPPQDGRGISKQIRDEFSLIETAVNSKADIASPTFTGTPRAPTASPGSSGTQIATLDYANALAFLSALPSQTGNNGKFVTTDGATASWNYINLPRSVRTSDTTLTAEDQSHFIDISSGTFTQTFDPCASLGSGWFCYIRNNGSGEITLQPDGSEKINSLSNFIMYSAEVRLIFSTGSALISVVISGFNKTFTSSGTFVKPPGYSALGGFIWGGGGGGTKSGGAAEAAGGGGGGCTPFIIPFGLLGSTETVTIGAGGAAGSATEGGNSTLGSLVTGYGAGTLGGGGVLSKGTATTGGQPDTESSTGNNYFGGGDGDGAGGNGGSSYYGGGAGGGAFGGSAGNGGNSVYGGAGGAGVDGGGSVKTAGTSIFGGNGGSAGDASSGANGAAPGGGGGATRTGATAGAGARGQLTIYGIV